MGHVGFYSNKIKCAETKKISCNPDHSIIYNTISKIKAKPKELFGKWQMHCGKLFSRKQIKSCIESPNKHNITPLYYIPFTHHGPWTPAFNSNKNYNFQKMKIIYIAHQSSCMHLVGKQNARMSKIEWDEDYRWQNKILAFMIAELWRSTESPADYITMSCPAQLFWIYFNKWYQF